MLATYSLPQHDGEYILHFKCHFELSPKNGLESINGTNVKIWRTASNLIHKWICARLPNAINTNFMSISQFQDLNGEGQLFNREGNLVSVGSSGSGLFPPNLWACRFEHPDREITQRRWRSDICILHQQGRIKLNVRVMYGIASSYFGPELARPTMSAPAIVLNIISSSSWTACLGGLQLSNRPIAPTSGKELWDALRDSTRSGPIVVVAESSQQTCPIDTNLLSRQLAGIAAVWLLPFGFQKEFTYFATKSHHCLPAAVRVYQPNLQPSNARDAMQHRFLAASVVEEQDPNEIVEWIVRALVRQPVLNDAHAVFSPEDVRQCLRTERLEQLKKQIESRESPVEKNSDDAEYLALLVQENQGLNEKRITLESDFNKKIQDFEEESFNQLCRSEELEQQIHELRFKMQNIENDTQRIKEKSNTDIVERKAVLWDSTHKLPTTVQETSTLAAKCWEEQICFTDRALKSLKKTAFTDSQILWQALWHMAYTLHPLYFGARTLPPKQVEEYFGNQAAGFTITHSEGTTTREDRELMRLRVDEFEGESIDIEPHLKYGNKAPKLLRIYYAIDTKFKRLIIGHCGDHLNNRSTMHMS